MFLRRQPSREGGEENIYIYIAKGIIYIYICIHIENTCQQDQNKHISKKQKKLICSKKYNIHIHMHTYIKYLSTRPKQTHIKCF